MEMMDAVAGLTQWRDEAIDALHKENTALRAEVLRLSELLWGAKCVYCGEVIGKDKQNQEIADGVLREHIQTCPKHPVAALRAERDELKAELGKGAKIIAEGIAIVEHLQAENDHIHEVIRNAIASGGVTEPALRMLEAVLEEKP